MSAETISPTTTAVHSALTIAEFCIRNRIGKALYFKLKAQGKGPREMHLSNVVRISLEAERGWQAEREKPDAEDRANAKRRAERGRTAGKAGIASPNHVTKRAKQEA